MTEFSAVRPHLEQRFKDKRIVFWHDLEAQYSDELDDIELRDVTVLQVANNEFAIKNRLLHDEPTAKFLIYRAGPVPQGIDNWLLDLELAHGVFTADRSALVAQDLGLTAEGIYEVVADHEGFFNSSARVASLKSLLNVDDDAKRVRAKMCAVLLNQADHSLLEITRALLIENAKGRNAKYQALCGFGLDEFYWRGVAEIYSYESPSPSVDDFTLWLYRTANQGFTAEDPGQLRNIKLDFASLRNDNRSREAMKALAGRASRYLDYSDTIAGAGYQELVDSYLFEETDKRITFDLARAVTDGTASAREVADVVRARQQSLWIDTYEKLYKALGAASELLTALSSIDFSMASFDDALQRYRDEWFRIDQSYRHFTWAYRTFEGPHPLTELREEVEKRYTNQFIYPLGNAWQQQLDKADRWKSAVFTAQRAFYRDYVAKLTGDNKKAVVIISDALRFEVAEELGSRIRQENRFDAQLDAVLGVLPSYTQLGMAALLPHHSLKHSADGKVVLADDLPTNGTDARAKVLESVDGTAIQAENYRALTPDERRDLHKHHQVLYIYHNVIDATGDKPGTESSVFEAADTTLTELVDLVKKAANANASNFLITADHGFLFQADPLPEQFFLSTKPQGDKILVANRRYVLGHGLKVDHAFSTFSSVQLELDSDIDIQIPKSIQRLKLPGGGTRFVHGGATLQEIVVPVLTVNKKRKSDVRPVNVEILQESDKITTGQLVVKLHQSEPVTDKVQPNRMRAGLYVGETLISNDPPPEIVFDSTSTDKRDRYQSVQLMLNKDADAFYNRMVELRLEEPIPNTNQWRVYAKAQYTLKQAFAPEFDF